MTEETKSPIVESPPADTLDFVRNLYELEVGWFRVAESKAQLILTVNGIFLGVLFGTMLGKGTNVQSLVGFFGPETWVLLFISVAALTGAISCAARSLWSWHRRRALEDFRRLGLNPAAPDTYRPEALWYFGGLGLLPVEKAAERLRHFDSAAEVVALSYNAVLLSRSLVRKYRLLNAGWALTAVNLIAFMLAGADVLVRAS
jgi:hypothetical protein